MPKKRKYEVLNGMNLPDGTRLEPGDVTDKIPNGDLHWLLRQGHIQLQEEQAVVEEPATPEDEKGGD